MIDNYINPNNLNFYPYLPQELLSISYEESKGLLIDLIGIDNFQKALNINIGYPSPVQNEKNTDWFKKSKIIGVNPRITSTYWGIVKYAMSFPESAIHIMPLWEPGDKGSFYVPINWKLSTEFLDPELQDIGFKTPESQLKLLINVLHSMGKTVGFDCVPHCDSYAEIVLANPSFFEWIKLDESATRQLFPPEINNNYIHKEVEMVIKHFLKENGDPKGKKINDNTLKNFFLSQITEEERINYLFGTEFFERNSRRIEILKYINRCGYYTIPVTEHFPIRPVLFDKIESEEHSSWANFYVKDMDKEAIIIGCATPYKWYEVDNEGYPIESKPIQKVWDYFISKQLSFQREYNFDFLRADMAHNQLSQAHQRCKSNGYSNKELWNDLKSKINKTTPYFATMAEAFFNTYYLDGGEDMQNKNFDVVLGCLNYQFINLDFTDILHKYLNDYTLKYDFKPCLTISSNDGDRLDRTNLNISETANQVRIFVSFFINYPSYMGIAYETKDFSSISEESYSNPYSKYQDLPFQWGNNLEFYSTLVDMRILYYTLKPIIEHNKFILLSKIYDLAICWAYLDKDENPLYLFVVNINTSSDKIVMENFLMFNNADIKTFLFEELYSSSNYNETFEHISIKKNDENITINNIQLGECRIYKYI